MPNKKFPIEICDSGENGRVSSSQLAGHEPEVNQAAALELRLYSKQTSLGNRGGIWGLEWFAMNDDVARELIELRELEKLLEEWDRSRNQDAGDAHDSSVPVSLKPRPSRNSGAVALSEPEENAAEANHQPERIFLT